MRVWDYHDVHVKSRTVCNKEKSFLALLFNWAACGATRGYFGKVVVGVHRPAPVIFTLFQSNIYKVNVRAYSPPPSGFMSWKRTTFNCVMAWHEVITHVKRRQPLNEDPFETSVLRFFVFFKRFYDEYVLEFFIHYLLKFKPMDDFFPSKMWLKISLCLWPECVAYIHWHFLSVPFSNDGRMGRFKFSLLFMYM